jgi:hypothetical protein
MKLMRFDVEVFRPPQVAKAASATLKNQKRCSTGVTIRKAGEEKLMRRVKVQPVKTSPGAAE